MSTETETDQLAAVERILQRRLVDEELERRPEYTGSGVVEPVRAIASGMGRSIAGGLSGIATQAIPGGETGAETVDRFQSGAFIPRTAAGQKNIKRLGDLAQFGISVLNYPVSGLGGLMEFLSGQGIDQAADTVNSVQSDGAGVTFGRRVFEETGSPLAATAAHILPEAAAEATGLGAAANTAKRAGAASELMSRALTYQTPTRQRIAQLIDEGSTRNETAGYRLEEPRQLPAPDGSPRPPDALPAPDSPQVSNLPSYLERGSARAMRDPYQMEAIRQGFDKGVIASIRAASDGDRSKMLEMVQRMKEGQGNAVYSLTNRPSDVVGQSLMGRFKVVSGANRDAGTRLDKIAKSLRGQRVDFSSPVNEFLSDLDSLGVQIGGDLKLNFKGSDIEGADGAMKLLSRITDRMKSPQEMDAYELHRMKRFIDEMVSYGKSAEGLTGRAENIVKRLRHNLDSVLDNKFEAYNEVNTTYAETISALDDLQTAVGRRIDLTGPNAEKAVGTVLRRLMSNAQSRVEILDSVLELDGVATKHGGSFDDDILTQVLFVDELDRVFGPPARTSFQGQIAQANARIPRSRGEFLERAVESAVESVRGINETSQFKAMEELLNSF